MSTERVRVCLSQTQQRPCEVPFPCFLEVAKTERVQMFQRWLYKYTKANGRELEWSALFLGKLRSLRPAFEGVL